MPSPGESPPRRARRPRRPRGLGHLPGLQVPPFYDSLVAKLIVWALTREEAINRARRALREYRIEGIKTTIPLHMRLLEDDAFRSGEYHTDYLEELLKKD